MKKQVPRQFSRFLPYTLLLILFLSLFLCFSGYVIWKDGDQHQLSIRIGSMGFVSYA